MTDAQSEWARVRPWLVPLFEASDLYDIEYVERAIERGDMHFWAGKNCVLVTEFTTFPKCRTLNVFAGAGDRGKCLREMTREIEPVLVAFAKANGCTKIRGEGLDETWRPVTERMGYRHHTTVMIKDLE